LTSGEIVGLRSGTMFVPGWYIENALDSILSSNVLGYNGFVWKGEFVESAKENSFVKNLSAFYITADTLEKDGLKVGDVIVKINNEEFTRETISRVLLKAPKTVTVEFIRGSETLQKTFEKQLIRP
jgi:membrane-associated protease RseP (regulator of RpoE activity)